VNEAAALRFDLQKSRRRIRPAIGLITSIGRR